MNTVTIPTTVMELFLPNGTLDWFDLKSGEKKEGEIYFTLVEKDIPPLPDNYKNEKIIFKGYRDYNISDFPIRGKKVHLKFRRRTWSIEGSPIRLKRNISLTAPGTTLEKEFANFLKDRG
jgi:hypothetical protein